MIAVLARQRLIRLATLLLVGLAVGSTHGQTTDLQRVFADKQLVVCFQGKGASMAFDAGVLHEAFDRIPAFKNNQVIVTGNSSGSVLAAYYSCFGFNETSVKYCEYRMLNADTSAIRKMQNTLNLTSKMLRGERTEISHDELRESVAVALGVEDWRNYRTIDEIVKRSTVRPRYPLLIIAGNKEVLDNRAAGDILLAKDYKEFDPKSCSVSWKPEVYEFYKENPDQFKTDNPGLKLGPDRYIGKAVTYFVDQSMFDLLSQIPAEERTGDLRLLTTPADVAMAIKASVSEPGYFDPTPDHDLSKLLTGDVVGQHATVGTRRYCGGVFMMMPVQDIRRMLPAVRVMGTGWSINPYSPRKIIQAWYLADIEQLARLNGWWADLELQPSKEVKRQMIVTRKMTTKEEFDAGVETTRAALETDQGLPTYVSPPHHPHPAAKAIMPSSGHDAFLDRTDPQQPKLKVQRGIRPLVAPAGAPPAPQPNS